jgi:hypothetical protein
MKMALLFGMIAGLLCAADPIVGTWKLNLSKSKYNPGPPPNAVTLTYEETADGTLKMREILDVGGTITRPVRCQVRSKGISNPRIRNIRHHLTTTDQRQHS